jgi:hypothetical protein
MTETTATLYYQRFRNSLFLRLIITVGITLFWTVQTIISNSYIGDKSFFPTFLIFSQLSVIAALTFGFLYAKKREETYKTGDFKTRLENYIKATMYRFSVLEISPVLLMVGFVMFGKVFFIVEAICIYIVLILHFPTKKRLSRDIDFLIE